MKKLAKGLSIIITALFCANPLALAKGKTHIKVGVEETEMYPYSIVESKVYKGFFHDLMVEFAKRNNYELEFVSYPIKRLMKSYISGEVEVKVPDSPSWAAEIKEGHKIVYSQGFVNYTHGTLFPKTDPKPEIKNIGTFLGFTLDAFKEEIKGEKIRVNEDPELQSLLEKLKYGFVDALYLNVKATEFAIKHNEWPYEIEWNKKYPYHESSFQISSFSRPEFVTQFNAFLAKEKALIKKLKKQYTLE